MHTRIDRVVKESGLTKTAFGKRIGIGQSMTSMICNGTAKPSDRTIADICREFSVRREWLERGEGPMRYPQPDTDMELINALLAGEPAATVRFVKRFMRGYLQLTPDRQAVMDEVLEELSKQE